MRVESDDAAVVDNGNAVAQPLGLFPVSYTHLDVYKRQRVHKVYLYALPVIVAGQAFTMYLDLGNPGWWQGITHALIG